MEIATSRGTFLASTIGRKVVMAVTGVVLFGFTIGHMLGNLQVYQGPEKLNAYAAFLKATPALLWGTRAILLVSVLLHIWAAISLARQNDRARPVPYAARRWREGSYASRTMMWSGPLLGLFIVYHLLHFTTGTAHPQFDEHDVYGNFILGFQQVPASIVYIVAMVALGFHLWHGAFSFFQSLGLRNPAWVRGLRTFATVTTLIVTLANLSFPIAVLAGVLTLE
jgi:succinate dehydrogenase / fumarate reductase cytochrome b subunit